MSAATRDASYCRKKGWKLHRLSRNARQEFSVSAWDCLERRLQYALTDSESVPEGTIEITQADTRQPLGQIPSVERLCPFDVIVTSPPYGDSRTTVQYGGASSLCLETVSQIDGFEGYFLSAQEIDRACLGKVSLPTDHTLVQPVRPYWAGSRHSAQFPSVVGFLSDFKRACTGLADCLKSGGKAILILGQRSTGGFRLKLDAFAVDVYEEHGLTLLAKERRILRSKRMPRYVNRYGRARSRRQRAKGVVPTMSTEIILTFEKV